jgi:aspartokinase/homoserine dehydrogenase 1
VLLDQLASQAPRLSEKFKVTLRVRGILASKRMLLSDTGIDLSRWKEELDAKAVPADLDRFVEHVRVDYLPHTVLIDCTANEALGRKYQEWLARGIHIVTPNKKANSGDLDYYRSLHETRRNSGAHYLYETTVGAGLPVVQTLRDLRDTGDDITSIEGIFSGTLAYLFNVYDGKAAFSDIKVESLVPAGLEKGSIDEVLDKLPQYDGAMRERYEAAKSRGKVLRYVGRLTSDGKATVGLVELDMKHAFANIALTDNVVRFATRRYCDNALVVQGPGAGPEVTAAAVFTDLLRVAGAMGVKRCAC